MTKKKQKFKISFIPFISVSLLAFSFNQKFEKKEAKIHIFKAQKKIINANAWPNIVNRLIYISLRNNKTIDFQSETFKKKKRKQAK